MRPLCACTAGIALTPCVRSNFTAKLDIPESAKAQLLSLTPASYVGDAAQQARSLPAHLAALRQ